MLNWYNGVTSNSVFVHVTASRELTFFQFACSIIKHAHNEVFNVPARYANVETGKFNIHNTN